MSSSRNRLWITITLVVLALSIVGYLQIEWVEQEIDIGYDEEARRNPFLAAERFLDQHGTRTETVSGLSLLDAPPPVEDVILLSASRESLSARRTESLVHWVRQGGLLLVVAHSVYDDVAEASTDPLLDSLGVFLIEPEEPEETDEAGAEEAEGGEADVSDAIAEDDSEGEVEASLEDMLADEDIPKRFGEILDRALEPARCREESEGLDFLTAGEAAHEVRVELSSPRELAVMNERLDEAAFSRDGQLLWLPVGEGTVVALTSIRPFTNSRIHCHDHAFLLWFLVENRGRVHMLHDPDVPSLATLAFRAMPATLSGGLALLFLVGAAQSIRFGLRGGEEEEPRREYLEHLEASMRFQHRNGGFGETFRRLANDLRGRASKDPRKWAQRAGLDPARVRDALSEQVPRDGREIVSRIRTMLKMRRTL